MAAAGMYMDVAKYSSSLIEIVPALDDAESALAIAPLNATSPSGQQEPEEWLNLYHNDKVYASFANDLFLLDIDEEEEMPPAHEVVDMALELTPLSKKLLAQNWIKPRVTTDDRAGLRMSWRNDRREVRAVILANATNERYLYWQEGSRYEAIPNFGSATLFERLNWLNESSIG